MIKLYNQFNLIDLAPSVKHYLDDIYRISVNEFDGCNLNYIVLDNQELSKYEYINDSYLSSMNNLQYFIKDDYIYFKIINLNSIMYSVVKLGFSYPYNLSIEGDGAKKLIIESRSNNSIYLTDSEGNRIPEYFESQAPYNRIWLVDSSLGSVNINNCGVSIAYFAPMTL